MNRLRSPAGRRRKAKKFELSKEHKQEIKEAFNLFDSDGSGTIDVRELKASMKALGYDVKKDDLRKIFFDLDRDTSEKITLNEFEKIMTERFSKRDTREEVDKIFRLFDEENTGFITFKNLKRVVQELGEDLEDEEIQEMIDEADKDADGQVSMDEFWRVMKKRSGNAIDEISSDED